MNNVCISSLENNSTNIIFLYTVFCMDDLKTELLSSISRIICNKYPQTGIYNTNLPNLYISRFNAQRMIYRHFIHPTFIVFLISGDEVKGEFGDSKF